MLRNFLNFFEKLILILINFHVTNDLLTVCLGESAYFHSGNLNMIVGGWLGSVRFGRPVSDRLFC